MSLSKIATSDMHGEKSAYFDGWKAYDRDPFHPKKNPNGVIQMGLAENQVSFFFFCVIKITTKIHLRKKACAKFFLICFSFHLI